ncbi:MAG: thiol:disulfide interchange protein DsbA/DsbL [Idiomarina sp.]|nr:thiol:disulfide interchange protein DsbA/DsbL [Idiomarina sp.]
MKKYLVATIAALSFMLTPVSASEFREGVHYEVISDTRTASPEIIDFFSVYCGTCYQFRPFGQMLRAEFGDVFKEYQVEMVAPRNMGEVIVRSWAVANILNVEEQFKDRIYHRHFVRNNQSRTINDIQEIFAEIGIEQAQFEQAYGSFAARSLTNRMRRSANDMRVSATPTYVVNGKYRIRQQGFSSSRNLFDDLLKLTHYLLEKE